MFPFKSKQSRAYTFLLQGIQQTSRVNCKQYLSDIRFL